MYRIEDFPIKRREPALGPNPDYSCAIYADPPSHDFCVFLVIAEVMRRVYKASSPLKVRLMFHDGMLGEYDYGPCSLKSRQAYPGYTDRDYSNMMVGNVLRPAIRMIGAQSLPDLHIPVLHDLVERYCEYDYHIGHLVDAGKLGVEIPKWHVPKWAQEEVREFLGHDWPVVITLREMSHQPERNSNLPDWLEFARRCMSRGFPTVIVRDSGMANCKMDGFLTYPRASSDVCVRAALYNAAFCNLSVQNGTNVWTNFSDAPYLLFKQLIPALPDWDHGKETGWRIQDHLEIGDQFPWAGPHQRMTWKDDTFENIRDEFDAFVSMQNAGPVRIAAQ